MAPRHDRIYRKGPRVATIWLNICLGLVLVAMLAVVAFVLLG